MNTKLVESLIQVINSLSPEERDLLEERLQNQSNWEKMKTRIIERGKIISDRNQENPITTDTISEIIYQMREERDEQLMQACFPKKDKK
jgi:hypothetical protein